MIVLAKAFDLWLRKPSVNGQFVPSEHFNVTNVNQSQLAVFGTVVAAIAAAFAAIFSGLQAYIANQSYLQSDRAWLNISVDASKVSVGWDGYYGMWVEAPLVATNDGSSPALNSQVFSVIGVIPYGEDVTQMAHTFEGECSDPLQSAFDGQIIFMHDTYKMQFSKYLGWDEIKTWQKQNDNYTTLPYVYLLICAYYQITGDKSFHYTGRVYELGSNTEGYLTINHPEKPGDVDLSQSLDADFAD